MSEVWKGFIGSKKWQAVFLAIVTVWLGVLNGSITPREAIATTVSLLVAGVLAQTGADVGKEKAKVVAAAQEKLIAATAGMTPAEKAATLSAASKV